MEGWVYPNKAEVSTPRLRGRREYYPELLLSWFSSVTIIGNLVGAPVGGYLLYQFGVCHTLTLTNFQTIYLVSGAAGVLALLLALTALKREAPQASGRGLQESLHRFLAGIKEVISDRRVVVTSSMEGLQNLTVGALEAFLPIYAVKVAGLNEFQAGLLWGVQVLVTILAKPIMGKTSDRYGRTPLVALGMVLCAFSFAAILLLRNFYAPDHGHGVWTGRGPGHLLGRGPGGGHLPGKALRHGHGHLRHHLRHRPCLRTHTGRPVNRPVGLFPFLPDPGGVAYCRHTGVSLCWLMWVRVNCWRR